MCIYAFICICVSTHPCSLRPAVILKGVSPLRTAANLDALASGNSLCSPLRPKEVHLERESPLSPLERHSAPIISVEDAWLPRHATEHHRPAKCDFPSHNVCEHWPPATWCG